VTRAPALLVAAGLCAVAAPSTAAHACALFEVSESDRRPSLAYEQTLIVYDAEKHREHFVREVVFQEARETFGFVVPTPARPEVAKVKKSPFAKLREEFPFRWVNPERVARIAAAGMGDDVEVLEVTRVGRFTAFVLSASDAAGLKSWLSQNGFATPPETAVWLAHYVKLGFFYVAMRYEPSPGDRGRTKSETVRISSIRRSRTTLTSNRCAGGKARGGPAAAGDLARLHPRLRAGGAAIGREGRPGAAVPGRIPLPRRTFVRARLPSTRRCSPTASCGCSASPIRRLRNGFGDVDFVPEDADAGGTPASKLPVVATDAGRRFDPYLRDKVAPFRRRAWTDDHPQWTAPGSTR
jgi:hypothetical protein